MDMDMDMATMDTMARGLLKPSLDMVIMVMDMVLDMVLDMVMDMAMVTMDIMARGLLMPSQLPLLSQDMDIMVRQEPECCYFLEFSIPEVDQNRSSQKQT